MTYRELLTNNPIIRKLTLLQFIAYFGSWFSNVAIYTMVVDFGSSAFIIALVTAMHLLPAVIIGPFSGAIIDKVRVKALMLSLLLIELVMTLLLLTIDKKEELWILMLLIFIRMGSSSMFFSTEMTLLPKLISGRALQKANEIHSIIWSFTYAAGMALSGVVVHTFGIKISILIDGLFFIAAIMVFFTIEFKVEIIHTKEKISSMIKDGFLYLKKNKLVLHLIFFHSSIGLTSFDTLVTLLAKNEYKYVIAVPLAIGITNAVRAFALMIGPLFITDRVNNNNLVYLLIFQGCSIILWSVLQFSFYYSLIAMFLTGLMTTTIWSYTYALIQENVEQKYLGRVISYNDMIFMISNIATTMFIGIAAAFLSLELITAIIGTGFFVFAIYFNWIKKFL